MVRPALALIATLAIIEAQSLGAQTTAVNGRRPNRLVIRNAMVVDGNGTPAKGPFDIVIEGNKIREVIPLDAVSMREDSTKRAAGDVVIDAAGKYVLPGLINAHGHVQDERGGVPQPLDYELKMWLANGITTVRDVGSDSKKTLALREKSNAGEVAAPRILHYPFFSSPKGPFTPAEARERVRELKRMGVDGIKIGGIDRDLLEAMQDESHKLGLRTAHHVAVEETTVWDDVKYGTTSIEHWYGIPDAAFPDKVQHFPSDYNFNNETHRFRWAGRIWREANQDKLKELFAAMVKANVSWVPTLDIYEASRDLQRAQTQPWFKDYLHPTLEQYFKPNASNHGSYFVGWSSTDEAYWKENYRIWMAALRQFEQMGGTIGVGDDAGFIYQLYGFGLIREMELHQEAGFHPIKIIQHATGNNARILGKENEIGRIRPGYLADVIVVNGNPLEDLKVLYATGTEGVKDGKIVPTGGIEWTIKDGIPYHGPTLLREVKDIVTRARAERAATRTAQP